MMIPSILGDGYELSKLTASWAVLYPGLPDNVYPT